MPVKADNTTRSNGMTEEVSVMLLSEAAELLKTKKLEDAIVFVLPDTGKARFNPSHLIESGKSAGKYSKATFVVAELGSNFAGVPIPYFQSLGNVKGLPLVAKLSIIAQPPNIDAVTIEQALGKQANTASA